MSECSDSTAAHETRLQAVRNFEETVRRYFEVQAEADKASGPLYAHDEDRPEPQTFADADELLARPGRQQMRQRELSEQWSKLRLDGNAVAAIAITFGLDPMTFCVRPTVGAADLDAAMRECWKLKLVLEAEKAKRGSGQTPAADGSKLNSSRLTRKEIADRLGLTYAHVSRLAGDGIFGVERDKTFDAEDVEKYRTHPGKRRDQTSAKAKATRRIASFKRTIERSG